MKLALSCFELTLLTLYFTKFCMNKVMIMEKNEIILKREIVYIKERLFMIFRDYL